LHYDATTGEFTWRAARGNTVKAGDRAGGIKNDGYWVIYIDWKRYAGHRLAWLYVYGFPLPKELDHINRNRADNRIANLRPATRNQTRANSIATHNGLKGATPHRRKWKAQIGYNGRRFYLGIFSTPELAHQAYLAKAKELFGEFACDGT